jgi:NADPH-dependent 2,4-dienoyl-CoA reductase/sulfur reductase-like enzyme
VCEASWQLGGQVLLAQLLPGRMEFGGAATNLKQELIRLGIEVRLRTRVDQAVVSELVPDAVIVATGARPIIPTIEGEHHGKLVTPWDILNNKASMGNRVFVSDHIGDWAAPGIAERLAAEGRNVTLLTMQSRPGEAIGMLGDQVAGRMHELGIEVIPFARLFGGR